MNVFKQISWAGVGMAMLWSVGTAVGSPGEGAVLPPTVARFNTPIYFEAVDGAEYLGRIPQGVFQLSAGEARVTVRQRTGTSVAGRLNGYAHRNPGDVTVSTLKFSLLGANPKAPISGQEELPGRINYFIGSNPADWRTGLSTYTKVKVQGAYPGVDLIYYGNQERLEYDFVVAPGADPKPIAFQIAGADSVTVDGQGDLVLKTGGAELRQHRPIVYQEKDGQRRTVEAQFELSAAQTVGFRLGEYDRTLPLVIDPVLSYARMVGGKSTDTGWDLALDNSGNIYVAGETVSTQLPTTAGAFQSGYAGGYPSAGGDAFVAKFNNSGVLQYLSYLGGSGNDAALGIAVDAGGNAYLTGVTDSTNFPTKSAIFSKISGTNNLYINLPPFDAFVVKMNPTGSGLVYSTYLGGSREDQGIGIAVDSAGSAYVTGFTLSQDFPVYNALQSTNAGFDDLFVCKLTPSGTSFVYSTYLGGAYDDHGGGIAIDAAGRAFLTGYTISTNYPVTAGAFQHELSAVQDAFLTVLEPSGTSLNYSSFIGGAGNDVGYRVALDAQGNAYVTGSENASGFPVTPGKINPGGLYVSVNGGANWNLRSDGLYYNQVDAIMVDAKTPTRVYVGNYRGLFRSLDGGLSWNSAFPNPIQFTAISQDPVNTDTIYAGQTYLYKTINGGSTWSQCSTGLSLVGLSRIVVDPLRRTNLYAATLNGVYRSTNSAASWLRSSAGLKDVHVTDMVINPLNISNLFAVTWDGVYRSTNATINWQTITPSFTNFQAVKIAIDPANPSRLYIAGDGGVARSLTSGSNWTRLTVGFGVTNVLALALDPTDASTVYIGSTAGLHRSRDSGATWEPVTNGLPSMPIYSLAVNPANPNIVYCGTLVPRCLGADVFLTKFGPQGYSVTFGGCGADEGWAIAVNSAGVPIVVGTTGSTDFPVRGAAGSLSATNSGGKDVFVTAFAPDGSDYLYSFYLGGRVDDFGLGVATDPAGNIYIVGETSSTNFPTAGSGSVLSGGSDMFIAKISADPVLTATAAGSKLNLQWRAFSPEYSLERSANTGGAPVWNGVAGSPVLTNGWHQVLIDRTNASSLFRLRR